MLRQPSSLSLSYSTDRFVASNPNFHTSFFVCFFRTVYAKLTKIHRVNTCPYQGSRTIRTEEAIWLSLPRLRPHLFPVSNGGGGGTSSEIRRSKTAMKVEQVVFSDSAPSEGSSDEEGT